MPCLNEGRVRERGNGLGLFFFVEFEGGFPAAWNLAGEFAAASDAGKALAELAFAKSLEGSACVKRGARPESREDFFVTANPLDYHSAFNLSDGHFRGTSI
jgi:hypothetical protein